MAGHQRTADTPADGGRADTPAGGGQADTGGGAILRMGGADTGGRCHITPVTGYMALQCYS
jgi:hypothetical protein